MFLLFDIDDRSGKRARSVADECRRRLTEQQVNFGHPGTILKVVNAPLEFVGPDGIATKSHNASLPADRLPELNAKVGHPVELGSNRALLRDYPNLAGIFILLRLMELIGNLKFASRKLRTKSPDCGGRK